MPSPLVRPLFSGPIDIVGDVHGEIDALHSLLFQLGYANDGVHPEGRRLVFVGDLTDRGPNSPAVVRLVARLLDEGLAQCVLGNHDLNLLLGDRKHGNHWFFGEREALEKDGPIVPQALADWPMREETLRLFRRLPLVLERADIRVVHACWDATAVEQMRQETGGDVASLFHRQQAAIDEALDLLSSGQIQLTDFLLRPNLTQAQAEAIFTCRNAEGEIIPGPLHAAILDPTGRELARQNCNAVKMLTSGPERRVPIPFTAGGKLRYEGRVPWWLRYEDEPLCVFGHYGRVRLPGDSLDDWHFDEARPYALLGKGNALCVDYAVTRRWRERSAGGAPYRTALAALRWPVEGSKEVPWLYFDTGRPVPLG